MNNAIAAAAAELNSNKRKIFLPTDDQALSNFAAELGQALRAAEAEIFLRETYVVEARQAPGKPAALCRMEAERFRTWVEDYVVTMARRLDARGKASDAIASMSRDTAAAVLASPQFQKCLRPLVRIFSAAVPAVRPDGSVRLLSRGYDPTELAYVCGPDNYADEVKSVAEAKEVILDLFGEFQFDDTDDRNLSVAVAAMLTPYARLLLRPRDTLPFFAYTANDAGAGKTLCAKIAIAVNFGSAAEVPLGQDPDEIKKVLATKTLEGAGYILFDNVRGAIDAPALEAYGTSGEVEDRLLRKNEMVRGIPAVIYITGNGVRLKGDLPSRVLWVELFMPDNRPEDRVFKRDLAEDDLIAMRPRVLAAMWRLVESWVAAGRPVYGCKSRHKQWANVIGSILRHHEFTDPTAAPVLKSGHVDEADQLGQMLAAMTTETDYTTDALIDLCQAAGVFEKELENWQGETTDDRTKRVVKSFMTRMFAKVERRIYGGRMLVRHGKAKFRRFRVEQVDQAVPV